MRISQIVLDVRSNLLRLLWVKRVICRGVCVLDVALVLFGLLFTKVNVNTFALLSIILLLIARIIGDLDIM